MDAPGSARKIPGKDADQDAPAAKRPLLVEDPRTTAMLAMSRFCQERWVRDMVKLHMHRGERMELALLSGDAGCGKSYALALLHKKLTSMNVTVGVSAMTNKAATALMQTGSLERVYTFHKLMGFTHDMLDEALPIQDFTKRYLKTYGSVQRVFTRMHRSEISQDPNQEAARHLCTHPRPESCAVCSEMFGRLRVSRSPADALPMKDAPQFLGVNVLIIDEYGLMTEVLFERMLGCLALFYGADKGPLIIFSGSVSQLQPTKSQRCIWETDRFEKLLASSTPLLVNRRQFRDPGYAEATTYLQFNTITEESRRIFRSQVSVSDSQVMDPAYEPDKIRIFHKDEQQKAYTAAYMKEIKGSRSGNVYLSVVKNHAYSQGPKAWYEVLDEASARFSKLFSKPKYQTGVRSTERDYLRVQMLWIGCKVRLIWYMGRCGIQVADAERQRERTPCPDAEGVIQSIRFNRVGGFNEFYVEGSQSGILYKVAPSKWQYSNWTVTTHPLACLLAMNTYECQGSTLHEKVFYHPPRCYFKSEIKPSVYVALTRVERRENLQMTNCNFAQENSDQCFYHEKLVAYRKRVEMNYSSQSP